VSSRISRRWRMDLWDYLAEAQVDVLRVVATSKQGHGGRIIVVRRKAEGLS
jgi:hypothetical protein